MATEVVTTCDFCGVKKGNGNHWFRIDESRDSYGIAAWSTDAIYNEHHACSDACVVAFTQQWLSAQKAKSEVLCEKS